MADHRGHVLVTGASTGIGAACAVALAEAGYSVFAGVRKREDGERVKVRAPGKIESVILDVTDGRSIETAAKEIELATGDAGLAGLVNNAGVAIAGPLEFLPIEELRRQLEINVIGQIAVTQAFLPLLRKSKGRIVNMGSTSGKLSTAFLGPYCASKFALEALTDALRMELAPWGIHVSIIEPGAIATPIWEKSSAAGDKLIGELPARGKELYGPQLEAVKKTAAKMNRNASPTKIVTDAVLHALTAARPKTRYAVGSNAFVEMALARFCPDRMRDKVILKEMRLPGAPA